MGKRIGIPFPTKGENGKQSPAYSRCWHLVHKMGKPLAEAVDQVHREIEDGTLGHQKPRKQKDEIPEGRPEPIHEVEPESDPVEKLTNVNSVRAAKPVPDPITPLERIEKKLDRMNTHLAEIARQLTRIADRESPKPGMEVSVDLQPPRERKVPSSVRHSENGLVVGDKVRRIGSGEKGEVTRILPGRKNVEVRFMLGTKTLPIDQVELMEAGG